MNTPLLPELEISGTPTSSERSITPPIESESESTSREPPLNTSVVGVSTDEDIGMCLGTFLMWLLLVLFIILLIMYCGKP